MGNRHFQRSESHFQGSESKIRGNHHFQGSGSKIRGNSHFQGSESLFSRNEQKIGEILHKWAKKCRKNVIFQSQKTAARVEKKKRNFCPLFLTLLCPFLAHFLPISSFLGVRTQNQGKSQLLGVRIENQGKFPLLGVRIENQGKPPLLGVRNPELG